MRRIVLPFFLFIFLTSVSFLSAQDWEEGKQLVEWEPVGGAAYYQIVVTLNDVVVVDRITEENRAPLFLNPGEYRYKVIVLNKFKKIVSESEWRELNVVSALQPLIRKVEPSVINSNNKGELSLTAEILNLMPESIITLSVNGSSVVCSWVQTGENFYSIHVSDPLLGKPGILSMTVTDPSGKKDRMENAVTINPLVPPRPEKLSVTAGHYGDIFLDMELEGSGFEENVILEFSGVSDLVITDTVTKSPDKVVFNLDLKILPPGTYDLIVRNPSGLEDTLEQAFTVYAVGENIPEFETTGHGKKKRPWGSKIAGIGAGYHCGFLNGPLNNLYDYSVTGADIRVRLSFKNDFFLKAPFLKQMGLDFGVSYMLYPAKSEFGSYNLHIIGSDICLFYKTPFPIFLNIVLKGGMGACFSLVRGDGLLGDLKTETFDFQTLAGGGLELAFAQRVYLEMGVMIRWQFLISGVNTHFEPYAVLGVFLH